MCDVSDPALSEVYQEIRKDSNPTNWVVLGYDGNRIVIQNKGEGGLAEMKGAFNDSEAQYGYARVTTGDEESRRTKFILFSWCGDAVGALKRAKMSVHKASIKTVFKDFAIEVHATNPDELNEEEIMNKLRKAGGADYSGNKSGN